MSQIIEGTKQVYKGTTDTGEGVTGVFQGVTGILSTGFKFAGKGFQMLGKLVGGEEPPVLRRSARIAAGPRVTYYAKPKTRSPKRKSK